jgi:hypothetical protein
MFFVLAFRQISVFVYPFGDKEVRKRYEQQYEQCQSAGFVVEECADEKQEGVAQQALVFEQAEEGEHDGEERPEIELGEQQGVGLVEREDPGEEVQCYFGVEGHLIVWCSV